LVEGNGIPVGLTVDGANRNDMKLTEATLASIPDDAQRPRPTEDDPQGLCLDKGYDYDEVRQIVEEFGFTAHIRSRAAIPGLQCFIFQILVCPRALVTCTP
jgi:putative transposase